MQYLWYLNLDSRKCNQLSPYVSGLLGVCLFFSNMLGVDIMSSLSSSIFSRWQVLTAQSDTKEEVWYLAYSTTQACLLMGDELDLILYRRCTVCNKYINYVKQYTKILSMHSWCQCGCGWVKILGLKTSMMISSEVLSSSTQHNNFTIIVIPTRIRFWWQELFIFSRNPYNCSDQVVWVGWFYWSCNNNFFMQQAVFDTQIREILEIFNSSVYSGIHCHHFNWNFLDLCVI